MEFIKASEIPGMVEKYSAHSEKPMPLEEYMVDVIKDIYRFAATRPFSVGLWVENGG